jgi:hypothetical protein
VPQELELRLSKLALGKFYVKRCSFQEREDLPYVVFVLCLGFAIDEDIIYIEYAKLA